MMNSHGQHSSCKNTISDVSDFFAMGIKTLAKVIEICKNVCIIIEIETENTFLI